MANARLAMNQQATEKMKSMPEGDRSTVLREKPVRQVIGAEVLTMRFLNAFIKAEI